MEMTACLISIGDFSLTRALVETKNLMKVYSSGDDALPALNGVNIKIARGEFVAIMGPSGSGKSTLMYLLGCLDRPTGGKYYLNGKNVAHFSQNRLSRIRREKIGFIFQSYNLLPRSTALENVELPLAYRGVSDRKCRKTAAKVLTELGLGDRLSHFPNQLSGGEQQRVAIARVIATRPDLILADEPTGSLDSRTSSQVLDLLGDLNRRDGQTIVLVTHDDSTARRARRIIRIRDGQIV